MTSVWLKPMLLSANGSVTSIIPEDTAPERSPNVRMVFFMAANVGAQAGECVVRTGDFAPDPSKSCFRVRSRLWSGNQPERLADLDGLGSSIDAQLVEQPARVRLHRVFADEQRAGNLAVAHPRRDER